MKVLLYADLRTHHAQSFLDGLRAGGLTVFPVSSTAPDSTPTGAEFRDQSASDRTRYDVASRLRRAVVDRGLNVKVRALFERRSESVDPLQVLDTALARQRVRSQRTAVLDAVRRHRPDAVHALRLPYEGLMLLTALAGRTDRTPMSVSTWGQDFRYQAVRDPALRRWIRRVMPLVDGLHVDAVQDYRQAVQFGLREAVPWIFAAGNLGVDTALFRPGPKDNLVLYPRGLRRYVNHRAFLALVEANRGTGIRFVGVGLERDPQAVALAAHTENGLELRPEMPREDYAALLRRARAVVSPATSDGTPNSVLEAIAAGCHPIAGDIAPVRDLHERSPAPMTLLDPARPDAWSLRLDRQEWWAAREDAPPPLPTEFDRAANIERFPRFFDALVSAASSTEETT